jgi:hypothetical protein
MSDTSGSLAGFASLEEMLEVRKRNTKKRQSSSF